MSTSARLLGYYGGFGFCVFLGWAAGAAGEFLVAMTDARRSRFDRTARGLALLGLVHPGFALCGLDIARQLVRVDEVPSERAETTLRIATIGAVAAVAFAASVIAVVTAR